MATAGDGAASYEGGGAGGKFRKRPFRRSGPATPYDRPPTALRINNPSFFTKLVEPTSRLIYAGANRLFGVFRKRLPPVPPQRPSANIEEPRNGLQEASPNNSIGVSEHSADQGGNLGSLSAATEISDLEQMLKQKTFTRSEIEHLTTLLRSRTTESPSDDVNKNVRAKVSNTASHLLRLEASTSGPLNKNGNERDNLHAAVTTPILSSRVLEEDIASPTELAKAYMGTRPAKVSPSMLGSSSQAPRQDLALLSNTIPKTPIVSATPKTSSSFRGLENGFTAPRSRGRSAIYSMARTPYSRGPSTFSQKGINSDYGRAAASPSWTPSQSPLEREGPFGSNKMALKRRSSALDDDIGSGGPLRRIRQKANLLPQGNSISRPRREFGSSALQQASTSGQKLLLMNETEPKVPKAMEENGETSMSSSGYASVPTKSSQMATKILQQLERLSPKEKSSGSRLAGLSEKSPTKLTSNMLHGQALRSLEKVESPKLLSSPQDGQNSEAEHHTWLPDARESNTRNKEKVEENGPRKFAIPRNMLTSVSGNSTVPIRDNAPIVADSTLKLTAEPPQKKRAFQMSAHEDSFELDDDIHSNGHVSIPLAENKKPETPAVANNDVSAGTLPEVVQTTTPPQVIQTSALLEVSKTSSQEVSRTQEPPEVAKIPALPEFKRSDDYKSPPKTDFSEQKMGFNFSASPPSGTTTQPAVLSQSTSIVDKVAPQKEPNAFPTFSTSAKSAEKVPSFLFSANERKQDAGSDPKPLGSISVFNSAPKNDQAQVPVSSKDDVGNSQKLENTFAKSESLPSAATPAATSTTGIFSFGGTAKTTSVSNGTPASNPSMFGSSAPFPAFGANNTNQVFNNSSSNITSSVTTATIVSTTSASSNVSSPAPIFSFGSAVASTAPTSVSEAPATDVTKDKEPNPFAAPTTGSSIFGFSSPATTSATTNNQSQGSFFNDATGSQANAPPSAAITQAVPFKFGSSTPSPISDTTTSGSSLFGSSAPAFSSAPSFGLSSAVTSSETKSGSSAGGSTTSIFGSTWQPPKSSPFGSTFSSPPTTFSFGASSTSMPTPSSSPIMFRSSNTGASTGASMFSFTSAAPTNPSFPGAGGQSVFGNSTPVFGAATASPNNNDQMSMEDSMAEDSMQTPTPSVPAFGQAPAGASGFMFGSATPPPPTNPFQFGGQPSQAPLVPNPFQASGSVEFNAGGSFSLGSGGGDKSGRRIVRAKGKNRRK